MPWVWTSVSTKLDLPDMIAKLNTRMKGIEHSAETDLSRTVLTDEIRTVTVSHVWSASQTLNGGFTGGASANITINTNKFTVAASTGNTAIGGTLGVTGAATLSSTLGVTGKLTATGGIDVPTSAAGNTHSGTYTPTYTNVTNVAAINAYECTYLRVGNTVTVSGFIEMDPTSTGATEFAISLPVASDFTTNKQCAGTMAATSFSEVFTIEADATNNRAKVSGLAVDATATACTFIFAYRVL